MVAGSGDLRLKTLRQAFKPGDCMMRLGSAAAMTVPVNEPILDPNMKGFAADKGGIWLIQGTAVFCPCDEMVQGCFCKRCLYQTG